MAQPWERDWSAPAAGNTENKKPWERGWSAPAASAADSEGRTAADVLKDTGISMLKMAVNVPQAAVGLLDLGTQGYAGKTLEGIGFRPEAAKQMLDEAYSAPQQAANKAVREADGFIPTAKAALENPSVIAHSAIESLGMMGAGGLVARGILGVAPRVASWLAGGLGEGVVGAGSAAEQIRSESKDGLLTGKQVGAALASGAGTAALGAAGGKIAQRLGLPDVDTMLATGGRAALKSPAGFMKAVVGSGISEGVFEELPQSIQEQMWQNYATDKPLGDGVGNAAALGMLTGAAMGGAGGGFNAAASSLLKDKAAPEEAQAAAPTGTPVNAAELLGETPPAAAASTAEPTEAEKALSAPRRITDLDRVQEIDQELSGQADAGKAVELTREREQLTANWPKTTPGSTASFTTEAGARVDGQYALVEADDLQTSHDANLRPNPAYPQELQPRDRTRAASEAQISSIVGKLDPARLGISADAATGAPIIGADGLVESGNARTIALKRVFDANGQKAQDYRAWLRQHADQFGLQPEQVDGLRRPVLVRVRTTPVNRAEFARQANASTVAQMSPAEMARADAARIDAMDDLQPDEQGDFATSRDFIRRFVGRLPATEQAGMIDAGGRLSSSGYARVRNAVLAKAYGDSPILTRMVESMDDNLRNLSRALMIAAPRVAQARSLVQAGRLHDADITPHLVSAVEELGRLKDEGTSVQDALAQMGIDGDTYTPETRDLLQFLSENMRRPRRMAEFVTAYFDALEAMGDPNQGSLLGDAEPPKTGDLMDAAKRAAQPGDANGNTDAAQDAGRRDDREAAKDRKRDAGQPTAAARDRGGNEGDGKPAAVAAANDSPADGDWRLFGPESGTLGIPRAEMPQVKVKRRPALYEFLAERGITNERVTLHAKDLKPSQAEYSKDKANRAAELLDQEDEKQIVLVSADNYVADGHHRWVAAQAADRDVQAVKFSAPIRELLAAIHEFPGATKSNESAGQAALDPRQAAVQDLRDGLADLSMILTKHQRAAMVPENTPGLMPTLVNIAGAAIRIVGTDLKRVVAWVRDAMKADAKLKPLAGKIDAATIRKAAMQALDEMQGQATAQAGLFDEVPAAADVVQGDLFSVAPPAAAKAAMIDGRAYDAKRDNYVPPPAASIIPKAAMDAADALLAQYQTQSVEEVVSAADRQRAEALLAPVLQKAAEAKVEFDQKVIDIARQTGAIGQHLAPIKSLARGAVKLIEEGFDVGAMKDLLRSTIVVKSYADAQKVVDAIESNFKLLRAPKNRTGDAALRAQGKDVAAEDPAKYGGYSDIMVNVVMPNGTIAEIQINVPQMLAAKAEQGHALYERLRSMPKGAAGFAELTAGSLAFYAAARAALTNSASVNLDQRAGQDLAGAKPASGAFSSSEKTLPSGKRTNDRSTPSPSDRSMANSQPGGNFDGTSIATSTAQSVASLPDLLGGVNDDSATDDRDSAQGTPPAAARKSGGKRRAAPVRAGDGGPDLFAGWQPDAGAASEGWVGQARPDGVRRSDADGGSSQPRGAARRGAGVPAGRDIAPKSGLNYRFTDEDLSYEGSWFKKAEQNVAALELLKRLQADGRQATREEQKTLARWIGWGAGEIANSIFSPAAEKKAPVYLAFVEAQAAVQGLSRIEPSHPSYWTLYQRLSFLPNEPRLSYREAIPASRVTAKNFGLDSEDMRWQPLRARIQAAMTAEEWAEARRTTQYAHFTSKGVVRSMWAALYRFGFKGGTILEPGAGNGVFPGLMPEAMAVNSAYTGIEYDSITGGILKQLQPDERILVESFVDTQLPKNFFDVAIGNPPFSGSKILSDPEYRKHAFALHDYFFAKTIDRTKPGGLVMFVTSRYTMDKLGDKARQYLADRADLVGAIRLPQTAFKQNAGTDVVTDVLFLRKKVPGETFQHGQAWLKTADVKTADGPAVVNEYFAAHPEMVLGKPALAGTMYAKNEYTVLPPDGDIEDLFAKAVESMPADIYTAQRGSAAEAAKVREIDFNPKAQKEGNYYLNDKGVLMQRENGVGQAVLDKKPADVEVIKAFVPLRDALKQAHYDQLNDGDWEPSLKRLQAEYEKFVAKHGRVNQFVTKTVRVKVDELDDDGSPTGRKIDDEEQRRVYPLQAKLQDDPDWTLVFALEKVNDDTGEITPSAFLTDRVLGKPAAAAIQGPHDAMLSVLNDVGRVDMAEIAARLDMTEEEAAESLGSAVYRDPEGDWVTSDEYLSGNVKRKLDVARAAAKADRRFDRNVQALEAAQPAPKSPAQISAGIGMNWIPGSDYAQFLRETAGVRSTVAWNEATRQWVVSHEAGYSTAKATADWGTGSRHAGEILEHALTGRPIKITKTVETGSNRTTVFDADATEAANQKLDALREAFERWIWADPDRANRLVQVYNDRFNTTVPRTFDGRHLTLPGASKKFRIFDHVKRGAWRIVQSGNTYLAHAVGSGKAQPLDAKVLTPAGWRRMGEIQPGDMVIAGDGSPTLVEAVFPQGAKPIYRVEFSDGSATECCDEHLWLTQTYRERSASQRAQKLGKTWPSGQGKVRSLSEIAKTLEAQHLCAKNHSIPMVGPVQFEAKALPLDPYVMGALLGDGCFTANSVMLASADQEVIDEVRARLPAGCEIVHRGRVDYAIVWRGEMRYAVGGGAVPSNPVMCVIRDAGLKGRRSHEKFVPHDFKVNSVEARVALLQGLMDADGTVEGRGTSTRFTTTSPRLADDVSEIVQSLGGVARRRRKSPTYTHDGVRRLGREAFDVCISLPPGISPFRLARKAKAALPKSRYQPARYITAVVPVGEKPAQCIRVAHPSHLYVTDDYIVTHNTFQMVISAMEQKRLGLIKKPMMVVPNHMLQQFAREWQELYPAARLMVADEANFHTDNRRRFVSRVALSDLDGVIITHSAFKLMDLDPEFKQKIIEEQLDYLRAALEDAGGDPADAASWERGKSKSRDPRVKQIEKQIENLEEKLKAALDGSGKDKNVRFDELGVDMLYVDEAHEFRKLDYGTSRQVKGIQPAGSQRSLDLYIKARYLEEKNPGRSLVMASGTPVTNTLAELFTVQRFMDRQTLIDRGIEDFDSWASMFGRERTALEPNAAGKYEPVTRFSKFVNVPELTQMFREFADVVTADQLAAMLGDKRPKVDGGARKIIVTPKSTAYGAYQKTLEQRVQASRDWRPSKDQPSNPDPIIKIIGDGRLAAIDMRFVSPGLPSDPDSKLNRMIDDVIAKFKETAGVEYLDDAGNIEPAKGSAIMVFSDLGFGAGVAATRGFNARAWFEKRLRDAGVPMAQVAFMSDYKKSTEKLKLFKDVNAGRVRLLIGSSKNMGTGVNAQQRLKAMFHLDSPWYPSDLEQREGRIIRQGNKNKLVQIYAYAAKGTYDENMWKMLASKQFFIDQALNGDENLREVEDLDSQSQYDMAAAMVADDPRVLQLAGARAEIEKLQRLFRAHEDQRMKFRRDYQWAQDTVAWGEKALPEAEAAAAKVPDLSGDNFRAKAGKTTIAERVKWGEALAAAYKDLSDRMQPTQTIGEIAGYQVRYVARQGDSSYTAHVELATPEPRLLFSHADSSAVGIAMTAQNAVADIARQPGRIRDQVQRARDMQDSLRERLSTPFPMAEMLAAKIQEAADLEQALQERAWRVERVDTGLGFDVQASSAEKAIEKAVASNGGTVADWRAIEAKIQADRAVGPGVAALSRGAGGGIAMPALRAVADRVATKLPGLPPVKVLASADDAPEALRAYISARGAAADVEGALHDGTIYLFASGIADETRAEHVLAEHEAAHAGLRGLLGAGLKQAMTAIYNQNAAVRQRAKRLMADGMPLADAVEEVIVDIPTAELAQLKGWRGLVERMRDTLKARGFERLAAWLDGLLAGHTTQQQRADLAVAALVREARGYVGKRRPAGTALSTKLADDLAAQEAWLTEKAKAAGYADIEDMLAQDFPMFERLAAQWRAEHPADVMLSRAGQAPAAATAAERAEAIIQKSASVPKPLDAAARMLTRATGIERLTTMLYGKGAELLDRLVPERVKAGIVADYGVPEAVIDQRARMQGAQREQLRQAGGLIEKLATLTRAESRVAYEWMSGDDTRAADELMKDLPEESVKVLQDVRVMIDQLSTEAVRLGQLDAEAHKRHRFAYLRRSYFKHAQELTDTEKAGRQRAISILGDQYKGRGMVVKASMKQVQNIAPTWWKRKIVDGKADTSLKGEKFLRLERRVARDAASADLDGFDADARRTKLAEVVYWPADEAVPTKYAEWTNAGKWEVRDTKAGDLILWRDFTKDERVKMGEIDEARYAIGKTLHRMVHDIEVGRYLEWLAQNHAKKPGETFVGTVVEASERYRDAFKPGEWVQVPDAKIQGTSVAKYGKLAGLYLPGPIWNDLRQVVGAQRIGPEWWRTMMTWWKTSKALAIDTPIPTPSGWTTMGEIKLGDPVFDEAGNVCHVMGATPVQLDRVCYEVAFSDGEKIVADAEHMWFTIMRGKPGVRTTEEILATLKEGTRGDANHHVPVAGALDLYDVPVPVHPYVLGAWLGDGDSNRARITQGERDAPQIIAHLEAAGVKCAPPSRDRRSSAMTFWVRRGEDGCTRGHGPSFMTARGDCRECANLSERLKRRGEFLPAGQHPSIQVRLREMNLFGNKHIPATYLRGSEEQRRELLMGLMDTDGHITKRGECAFTTTIPQLRDGVVELLRSLGYKPSCFEWQPACKGRPGKIAWRISFKAYADKPVFKLLRKRDRLQPPPARAQRSQTRSIVAITPVKSVPVRCIAVSSESRLYLAGRGMIPTHNTALSPGVHTNNVMSNFVMADWHDVSAAHVAKSLRIILAARSGDGRGALGRAGNVAGKAFSIADREAAKEIVARYEMSGGSIGGWVTQEIANDQLAPIVEALKKEVNATLRDAMPAEIGVYSAMQHVLHARFPQAWEAFKGSRTAEVVSQDAKNLIDLYQAEDDVFRLAAWLKAKEQGASDHDAGKVSRKSFLDYQINAPWVAAMRQTALPFVSFTYRALPMLLEVAAKRPHKILKLMAVVGALNALGVMIGGGGDDDERKLLPEEKSGRIWGMVPKLIRMPWNDAHGSPVYLDIRRWIPVGDVFDLGQGHAALPVPPSLMPGGPAAVLAEVAFNRSMFTGKAITLETDTMTEKARKVADHLWKAAMPNIVGVPGTYATEGVVGAATGRTDAFGREMSTTQAMASAMGVKVGSYPADVLRRNIIAKRNAEVNEIDMQISALKRQRQTNRIDADEFEEKMAAQQQKRAKLMTEAAEKLK